jgi:hypothetical protein
VSTGVVLNNRKDTGKRQYCPPLPAMDLSNLDSTAFAKEGYNQSHKTVVKNDTLPRSKPLRPATRRPSSVSAKRNLDSSAFAKEGTSFPSYRLRG